MITIPIITKQTGMLLHIARHYTSRLMKREQRGFTRVPPELRAKLVVGGVTIVPSCTSDISMSGVYLTCQQLLPINTECRVTIYLNSANRALRIRADGKIRRTEARGMAVEFQSVDLDSYYHLRQLVINNASDSPKIVAELSRRPGIKPFR